MNLPATDFVLLKCVLPQDYVSFFAIIVKDFRMHVVLTIQTVCFLERKGGRFFVVFSYDNNQPFTMLQ